MIWLSLSHNGTYSARESGFAFSYSLQPIYSLLATTWLASRGFITTLEGYMWELSSSVVTVLRRTEQKLS